MLHAIEPATLDASLITVNYLTIDRVKKLFSSMKASKPLRTHEVILIENGSSDPTRELLEAHFPDGRYRYAENRGFSAGNNRGMEVARGRYYILLNPDTELNPGMIDAWMDWMDAHPEIGISGPTIVYPDGSPQPSAYRYHGIWTPLLRRTWLGKTTWGKRLLDTFEQPFLTKREDYAEVEWLLGAALCVRREIAHELGGMDERFFLYFEDEDFCRRARAAGYRVAQISTLTIRHAYGKLSQGLSWFEMLRKKASREHIKSGIRYLLRYEIFGRFPGKKTTISTKNLWI